MGVGRVTATAPELLVRVRALVEQLVCECPWDPKQLEWYGEPDALCTKHRILELLTEDAA